MSRNNWFRRGEHFSLTGPVLFICVLVSDIVLLLCVVSMPGQPRFYKSSSQTCLHVVRLGMCLVCRFSGNSTATMGAYANK